MEIARLRRMDEGFDNPSVQMIGWYDLRAVEDGSTSRHVLVFDHQEEALSRFVAADIDGGSDFEAMEAVFECASPQPTEFALEALSRYVDATGEAPPFVRFVDFEKVDPRKLGERFEHLDDAARNSELEKIYQSDELAQLLYPSIRAFADAVYRVILDRRFGDDGFNEVIRIDSQKLLDDAAPADWDLRSIASDVRSRMGLTAGLPPVIAFTTKPAKSYWGCYWEENGGRILINSVLESDIIKPETMEFLLYHELLHHEMGAREGHSDLFRKREREFAGWREADAELDTLRERYRLP